MYELGEVWSVVSAPPLGVLRVWVGNDNGRPEHYTCLQMLGSIGACLVENFSCRSGKWADGSDAAGSGEEVETGYIHDAQ